MIAIRPVGRADLGAVRASLVASWHATYDRFHGAAKVTEITDQWHAPAALSRQVDSPGSVFLLAEEDRRVLGSAFAHIDDHGEVCLRRLYLDPGAEGRGIGRMLLDETLARLAERDVWLEVEPRNSRAIRFYEREGFVLDRPSGSCGGRADLDAVVMRRADRPVARAAINEDAQELFGLITLAFSAYPGCYVDPHQDYPDLLRPATFAAAKRARLWVVEDRRGRVRACVGLKAVGPEGVAELKTLYVRADQRRKGLGAALVDLVERTARDHGARRVILWSDTRFEDAHRLYERLGYVRTGGPRPLNDISNSEEYLFTKPLDREPSAQAE